MFLPVLIMTRNENRFLDTCVRSLKEKLSVPHHIYIIDNNSDDPEHLAVLEALSLDNAITVHRNKKNYWVLGLNNIIDKIRLNYPDSKYFMLTDGDIDFSTLGKKHFDQVISKLDSNASIGKIGFSLSWDNLLNDKRLSAILEQERKLYNEQKKIDEYYVSPVDTTAAIVRFDWSIESKGHFYPDHMRYLRPEMYSCRTPRNILVRHLGWDIYFSKKQSKKNINDKVICFTLVGGSIKKEILSQASWSVKYFYRCLSRPIYIYWIYRRYFFLLIYILRKGRRSFDNQ